MSRIGWTQGMQRFALALVLVSFLFLFSALFWDCCSVCKLSVCVCVWPALQGPWLCILNMQQPHAVRTIKHLEMVATAGQQQQKRLSQPCERIYELAMSGSCNMRHKGWGGMGWGVCYAGSRRYDVHPIILTQIKHNRWRCVCLCPTDARLAAALACHKTDNWLQRGPKMDACGSLSETAAHLVRCCPACCPSARLWSLVACPRVRASCYILLFALRSTTPAIGIFVAFTKVQRGQPLAACGKAMCCR